MARVRIVTLNLEQDHKRWEMRRELIAEQLVALEPDPTSPRLLFLSPRDGLAYVVDGESGETSAIIPTEGRIDEVLFSRDGSRVFLASRQDRVVYVYTWPELQRLDSVTLPERSPAR